MVFRKATPDDVDRILEIIEKAKVELGKLGLDQWQNGYPDREIIEDDVEKEIGYVIEEVGEDGKNIVGTVVLSDEKEIPYSKIEGKWISYDDYIVIHRLAVDSDLKNRGIATKILKFIEKVCLEKKILSLKTDTHENNEPMKKLLEKNGFSYCGVIYLEEPSEMDGKRLAYEKIIKIPRQFGDFRKEI